MQGDPWGYRPFELEKVASKGTKGKMQGFLGGLIVEDSPITYMKTDTELLSNGFVPRSGPAFRCQGISLIKLLGIDVRRFRADRV